MARFPNAQASTAVESCTDFCRFLSWCPLALGRVQAGKRCLWKPAAPLFQLSKWIQEKGQYSHVSKSHKNNWQWKQFILTFLVFSSWSPRPDKCPWYSYHHNSCWWLQFLLGYSVTGLDYVWEFDLGLEELKGACHYKKVHTSRHIFSVRSPPLWFWYAPSWVAAPPEWISRGKSNHSLHNGNASANFQGDWPSNTQWI